MPKTWSEPVSVRLRPDIGRRIEELAALDATTRGDVLRRVITRGLRAVEAAELAARPDPELTTAAAGSRG
jgi:predicted DNA-binding protein